jgi:hypothetical protein
MKKTSVTKITYLMRIFFIFIAYSFSDLYAESISLVMQDEQVMLPQPVGVNQICNDAIVRSTPITDFDLEDDGTAIHKKTGLMWQRCSVGKQWGDGACVGVASIVSWDIALKVASSSSAYGYDDWRLPNIKELLSIMENACALPAINAEIFDSELGDYWTASPNVEFYEMSHNSGGYGFRENESYVRLVRDGL